MFAQFKAIHTQRLHLWRRSFLRFTFTMHPISTTHRTIHTFMFMYFVCYILDIVFEKETTDKRLCGNASKYIYKIYRRWMNVSSKQNCSCTSSVDAVLSLSHMDGKRAFRTVATHFAHFYRSYI